MSIKNKILYFTLALSLSLAVSCSTSSKKDAESVDIPTVTFEPLGSDQKLTDEFSKVRFLQLEMTDDCIIGQIQKVEDVDGVLVVLTRSQEVLAFDKESGKFLRQIGTIGEGPDEYITATDIFYDKTHNSINILDRIKDNVVSYNVDGECIGKRKLDVLIQDARCAAISSDGYLMIGYNMVEDNEAYTLINPDGSYSNFDQFAPVYAKNMLVEVAARPMTSDGKNITFFKFLNDTLFSLVKGKITPIYKLSLKKQMPRKDVVAQLGSFEKQDLAEFCYSNGYFSGFNNIFETERYVVLVPSRSTLEGYFWIDKETGKGYHIPSSEKALVDKNLTRQGRSIANLIGSNEKELISYFPAEIEKEMFLHIFTTQPEVETFSPDLKPFWESVAPDGNPCLIIYEH